MSKRVPIMKIYLKKKYIEFNRPTITLLGNPPHLVFMLDDPNERLIVLPSSEETFSTYEIPKYYWQDKRQTCHVCRLPFFLTLQQKFSWSDDRLYVIRGIFQILEENQKLVVFNFADITEAMIKTKPKKNQGGTNDR